jgi:mxaJ protein
VSARGAAWWCAALIACLAPGARASTLTVCADPNNLPFSNRAGEGFENKLAELIAHDLGARLEYVWWAQRRGFARSTLGRDACDLWPGIAAGVDTVATTHPYYRSTYVFVTRVDAGLQGLSLDDERLRRLAVGVQMIGNDAMNTPPAHALARRGITGNVRGYMLYGDYGRPNPPAAIIDAVAHGDIDVGLVWGPLAGFFAGSASVPLAVEPVRPQSDGPQWPMTFEICMGVRRGNLALLARLNKLLDTEQPHIRALLRTYAIPTVAVNQTGALEVTREPH